ncbi:MAG: MerR family DNA-binding transcriptional regulator, partial [Alicyclobacillaceae bacterium]|nr:MerR family DNA-binding transcriptional regulator [Alicyclobacillaceae bacterium]
MFKISEFSKISRVSVKTLRYYDRLGLLKPARTD